MIGTKLTIKVLFLCASLASCAASSSKSNALAKEIADVSAFLSSDMSVWIMRWDEPVSEAHPVRVIIGGKNFAPSTRVGANEFDGLCIFEFANEVAAGNLKSLEIPNQLDPSTFPFRRRIGRFVVGATSSDLLGVALDQKGGSALDHPKLEEAWATASDILVLRDPSRSLIAYWSCRVMRYWRDKPFARPFGLLIGGKPNQGRLDDGHMEYDIAPDVDRFHIYFALGQLFGIVPFV